MDDVGIVRVVEWRLRLPMGEADARLRAACEAMGLSPEGPPGAISGRAKRSIMKNRWAADVSIEISPSPQGSVATTTVDMLGDKHYAVMDELAEQVGDDVFDDQGLAAAIGRLGKASRLFGRKEVRHVRNILRATEDVLELGQGQYGAKMGIVVMTTERLFFFEKSMMGSEQLEEFPLTSISSLSVNKKMTGEELHIFASGNQAQIGSMMHGQADAMVRALHSAKTAAASDNRAASSASASASRDPLERLEQLASLRDKGILTDDEFAAKKADILESM